MKVFQVLNEKYKDKKVKIDNVLYKVKEFNGKYYLINVITGFLKDNLDSCLLYNAVICESKDEEFQKIADKDIIIKDKEIEDITLTITSNYYDYESAKKQSDNIYISIDSKLGNISTSIDFDDFKDVVKYVDGLKKALDK